jgi:hypothetical protein
MERYRAGGGATYEEQQKTLNDANAMLMYEFAARALGNDSAWLFRSGDNDSFAVAWSNVPRGWRKMSARNVCLDESGVPIDMIVAVDPAKEPALQSIIDQLEELEKQQLAKRPNVGSQAAK